MKAGELVRHSTLSDWGVGVVVHVDPTGIDVNFSVVGRKRIAASHAAKLLTPVAASEVPADDPLRDPSRWAELERPEGQRTKSKERGSTAKLCEHCHKPLNRSQYRDGRALKSCPRCSSLDGGQHLFLEYPAAFGQSDERVSPGSPDGAQSYCVACRAGDDPSHTKTRCSSLGAPPP